MTDKETLPFKAARKLNMLIMHNEALAKDKSLQEKIIAWGLICWKKPEQIGAIYIIQY